MTRRTPGFAGFALAIWLAGCTTPGALLERSWIEVRSDSFSIYTSLAEPDARKLLEDLELFRATVSLVSNIKRQDPRVPTEIYAFRSTGDFIPFQPGRNVAGFFDAGLRGNRVAFTASGGNIAVNAVMYHEYTHFLVRNQDHLLYPPWFDEGFAELLGSVEVKNGWILVGTVPDHRRDSFTYLQALPFSRLIRAADFSRWPEQSVAMFYAQSWLLVHYLMYGRPKEEGDFSPLMTRYLKLLEQRVPVDEAFPEAFGISFAELQNRMENYTRKIPSYRFPRDAVKLEFETRVRPVSRDEMGVRLGWLALSVRKLDFAQRLFEQAAAANPSNSRAQAGLGDAQKYQLRWDEAEPFYRHALELAPNDWENHLEFGEYYLHRAQQEEADRGEHLMRAREHLRKAIELAPEIPEGYAMLGVTYVVGEDAPEPGIEALEHAARLLPSHPAIHLPLAQLHHRAGHRERAIELLHRVVHWSHASSAADEANKLLEELEGSPESTED